MYESAKQSGNYSALLAVDAVTGQTALHVAAANPSSSPDQLEIIWLLLHSGVRIETLDKLGHSCVTVAAMAGNTIGMSVILEYMLSQPQGPLNAQAVLTSIDDYNHFDILAHAVLADRKEPVLSLLGDYEYCHVQESRYCPSSRNILHLAAVNGSTNAFEALFKLCFDDISVLCNTPDVNGFMPLAYAAANCTRRHLRNGRLPKCFLGSSHPSHGSNAHGSSASHHHTSGHGSASAANSANSTSSASSVDSINSFASLVESLQVPIEALANGGANVALVSELNSDSKTWSSLVCDSRCYLDDTICVHAEFIISLLETGLVDVNQLHGTFGSEGSVVGVSALFLASLFGHIPVVKVLLVNGARQDVGAYSPLQASVATNNRSLTELLLSFNDDNEQKFLMDRPPLLTGTPKLKDSPLTIALANSAPLDEIEFFLNGPISGEDVQLAIISGKMDIVRALFKAGASSMTESEIYGKLTGLATAVDVESSQMLAFMIEDTRVALSSIVDHQGRNILHHICEYGQSNALLQIQEEIDINYTEEQRKEELRLLISPVPHAQGGGKVASPLELAARQEWSPCYKILQSYLQESGFSKAELIAIASAAHNNEKTQKNEEGPARSQYAASASISSGSKGKKTKASSSTGSKRVGDAGSRAGNNGGHRKSSAAHHANAVASTAASAFQDYMNLSTSQQMGMDTLKKAVSAKLADFVAQQSGKRHGGQHQHHQHSSSHHHHQQLQHTQHGQQSTEFAISEIPAIADEALYLKLDGLLKWIIQSNDPTPYFKVLHSAQQYKRVSVILLELHVVDTCMREALKATNPLNMQNWLRTLALLHRNDTPFLENQTLNLMVKLLSYPLFMETSKAQAYLMVTINNECAAHPKVSSLIVIKLSERENKTALLRFFSCCIKTVQDDEASPAGIGLLDLFTHIFLKDDSFAESYRRVMTNLVNAPTALSCIVTSLNSLYTKAIDMTASLRMIQRVSQYYPTRVVFAGAVLPILRLSATRLSDPAANAMHISAYAAFSDLLKFSNLPLQRLLWKVIRHSMFIDLGLTSPLLEPRTAACDVIVCLCRDPQIQQQLVADAKYFDLLLKLFTFLVPTMKPNGHITEAEALAMRECILALSFLWNQDPARITAVLSIPGALEFLLALYHTDGVSAVANRVIQIIWAHDPTLCQSLLSSSQLTMRLYQSYAEKSGFVYSQAHLMPLHQVEPFAVPKWYTHADGVLHEEWDPTAVCSYCGTSNATRAITLHNTSSEGDKRAYFCSPECQAADSIT